MKTTKKLFAALIIAALVCGFTACKKNEPNLNVSRITLKTAKKAGEKIGLLITVPTLEDKADLWIDMNNNGKKDAQDLLNADDIINVLKDWVVQSQVITIYGKIENLFCDTNELVLLDVSNCKTLERLGCSENQLTALDVSNCEKLKIFNCYSNRITGDNMTKLVNGLSDFKPEGSQFKPFRVLQDRNNDPGNRITKAQVAVAKAKNWSVWSRQNYTVVGE